MLRGLIFYSPVLAPLLMTIVFSAYVTWVENPECAYFLGINVSLLGLMVFCFALPITLALVTLYLFYFSFKTRGKDFYPPADIPWIGIFKRCSGKQAQIRKAAGYLLPLAGAWIVWLGISSFSEIADGRRLAEMSAAISEACKHQQAAHSIL